MALLNLMLMAADPEPDPWDAAEPEADPTGADVLGDDC